MEIFNKEYKIQLGNLIRTTREAHGISQIYLAEEGGSRENPYICSERYLRDIEQGKSVPNRIILEKLMEALNLDIGEWDRSHGREVRVRFDNECEDIIRLIFATEYTNAYKRYWELSKEEYYDKNKTYYKQNLEALEGSLIGLQVIIEPTVNSYEELEGALLRAIEALKLSKPSIQKKSGEIDTSYIEKSLFNLVEYRLISVIAKLLKMNDIIDETIEIYRSAIKSLEGDLVDTEIRRKMIPLLGYDLSNLLIEHKRYYGEALEVLKKGLHYSTLKGIGELTPFLKFNIGYAIWFITQDKAVDIYQEDIEEDVDDAYRNFKEAKDIFTLMGDILNVQQILSFTTQSTFMVWD